jgi:hypothetical protein
MRNWGNPVRYPASIISFYDKSNIPLRWCMWQSNWLRSDEIFLRKSQTTIPAHLLDLSTKSDE